MIQGVNEASSPQSNFLLFPLPDLSFLVGQDGGVYEGVGWHTQGSHTYGYNDIGLGIAFIGNFVGKGSTWSRGTLDDEVLCEIPGTQWG